MARSDVPDWVREKVPHELSIQFWCRRAWFEVVEELSDTVQWTIVFGVYSYGVYHLFHWYPALIIGTVLTVLWVWRPFFFEYNRWLHEIYVVARNENDKGGMFYKFWGGKSGFDRKFMDDPITDRSPSAVGGQNAAERAWGFLTGEQMNKLSLKSDNNQYIEGRRVTPRLKEAIDRVRHAVPHAQMMELDNAIQWTNEFTRLGLMGIWDKDEVRHHIDTVVRQQFYGQ